MEKDSTSQLDQMAIMLYFIIYINYIIDDTTQQQNNQERGRPHTLASDIKSMTSCTAHVKV